MILPVHRVLAPVFEVGTVGIPQFQARTRWFQLLIRIDGWNAYNEAIGIPSQMRIAHINSYLYMTAFPAVEPETMEAAEEKVNEAIYRLNALWDGDWLPEI